MRVYLTVLIFRKTGGSGTEKVWFFDMKADGFSLDDKRQLVSENDIPEIIKRFREKDTNELERERTDQSFVVPVEEIIENDYDLSINKYKEIVYEAVEYDSPELIMNRIEELEISIQKDMAELRKLLNI